MHLLSSFTKFERFVQYDKIVSSVLFWKLHFNFFLIFFLTIFKLFFSSTVLTFKSRDVSTGKIQVQPCRCWAPPSLIGIELRQVPENLGPKQTFLENAIAHQWRIRIQMRLQIGFDLFVLRYNSQHLLFSTSLKVKGVV